MTGHILLARVSSKVNWTAQGKFLTNSRSNLDCSTLANNGEISERRADFENPNSKPDFIYCMTGRFFCCGENIGLYGSLEDALSLCKSQGSRFYTAKSGNITNEILLGPYGVEPPEFVWTDKGSRLKLIFVT